MRGRCILASITIALFWAAPATARSVPGPAKQAAQLAGRLSSARTPAARRRALLSAFTAIGIGAYRRHGNGETLPPFRASHADIFDVEFDFMARQPLTARMTRLDQLAQLFGTAGVRHHAGAPLVAGDLARPIRRYVAWARAHPRRRGALPWLVFDALARRHGARGTVPSRLDAVQATIFLFQLGSDVRRMAGPPHSGAQAAAAPRARAAQAGSKYSLARFCDMLAGMNFSYGGASDLASGTVQAYREWRVYRKGGSPSGWRAGSRAAAFTLSRIVVAEILQAVVIHNMVEISAVGNGEQTHFGPADAPHGGRTAEPGHTMTFAIRIISHTGLDEDGWKLNCGNAFGLQLPPEGPIDKVDIDWANGFFTDFDWLKQHGTVTYDSRTDQNGEASLRYTPRDETPPGVEPVHDRKGVLKPSIALVRRFHGIVGTFLWDAIGLTTKTFNWRVEWHDPVMVSVAWHHVEREDDFFFGGDEWIKDSHHEADVLYTATIPLTGGFTSAAGESVGTGSAPLKILSITDREELLQQGSIGQVTQVLGDGEIKAELRVGKDGAKKVTLTVDRPPELEYTFDGVPSDEGDSNFGNMPGRATDTDGFTFVYTGPWQPGSGPVNPQAIPLGIFTKTDVDDLRGPAANGDPSTRHQEDTAVVEIFTSDLGAAP